MTSPVTIIPGKKRSDNSNEEKEEEKEDLMLNESTVDGERTEWQMKIDRVNTFNHENDIEAERKEKEMLRKERYQDIDFNSYKTMKKLNYLMK